MINLFPRKQAKLTERTIKDMEYAFKDLDGNEYYRFPPTTAFPLARHAKRGEIIAWMSAGLTASELHSLLDLADKELENMVMGKTGSLAKVGAIHSQIRMRKDLVIHTELMYQFIGVHYLLKDEPLYTVSDEIMDLKIESFKKMVAGGLLLDFFQLPELNNICNTIGLSRDEFQQAWIESEVEMKLMNQKIKYLTSESRLHKREKTSKIPS